VNKVTLKTEHGGEITIDIDLIDYYRIEAMSAGQPFSEETVEWKITLVLRDLGSLENIPITNIDEVRAALVTSSVAGTERWV
jgi:hypothetical protein